MIHIPPPHPQNDVLRVEMPSKIATVLSSGKRYKVLYGGRGGGKSWSIAKQLLLLGIQSPLRIMCARELQNSLEESSYQLLVDQIESLELHAYYRVIKGKIIGKPGTTAEGTRFTFSGIKNAGNIKSFEGADICWVEEAQQVSKESWKILIPTIRKPGSEIWVSFNPVFDDDFAYEHFIINMEDDVAIAMVNYYDNPWCPETIFLEAAKLKKKNVTSYDHVYGGGCLKEVEGAVFNLSHYGRYSRLPKDPMLIVHSWDTSYKEGDHNDPTVCSVWYVTKSAYYLAYVIRGRWNYPTIKKKMLELAEQDNPDIVLIEDKASGQSLIQEFKEHTLFNIVAITPLKDKETRARVSAAPIEAGRVLLPLHGDWLSEFEKEIMLFPPPAGSKVTKDQVDSQSQFLSYMQTHKPSKFAETMADIYGV